MKGAGQSPGRPSPPIPAATVPHSHGRTKPHRAPAAPFLGNRLETGAKGEQLQGVGLRRRQVCLSLVLS